MTAKAWTFLASKGRINDDATMRVFRSSKEKENVFEGCFITAEEREILMDYPRYFSED